MKKMTVICSIFVFVLSMVIASTAMAECPPGKTGVTIVAGHNTMEICVPDQAVDQIGGPGEVVIPATCPCFSQEDIETAIANDQNACGYMDIGTTIDGQPCFDSDVYAYGYNFAAHTAGFRAN